MNEARHTPGPWTYDYRRDAVDSSAGPVCFDVDIEADARLIAAAPDLLAACELVLRTAEGEDGDRIRRTMMAAIEACEAAVFKAVGNL